MHWKRALPGAVGCIAFFAGCGAAYGRSVTGDGSVPEGGSDLSRLSLEDLTKIQVSSVARRDEELSKTPAAVYVITREDIRQSGAVSLPEVFRMVPGMQVAQVYANVWAVSARGFNSRFENKMLVLVDGRSIYSEIYSGVFWEQNDLLLEDIDRIEVIRGPGGTLWGANAVNGIINIITLKAKRTQGAVVEGQAGVMAETASVRYGGEAGPRVQYRGFLKYLRRNSLVADDGSSANDNGSALRGGGRLDFQARPQDWLTFHGDLYSGGGEQRILAALPSGGSDVAPDSVKTSGGYGLARWEHQFRGSELALQGYFNQERHAEHAGAGVERTVDLDFEHRLPRMGRNELNWGLGYRLTTDHITGDPLPFLHDRHRDALYNLFLEDELTVVPDRLKLTGGFKLLHNSYTGLEVQPGVRALWTPQAHRTVWMAFSRAVRTPSVQERDLNFYETVPMEGPFPTEALAMGNPNFQSEIVKASEAGYRQQLGARISVDVAGFVNFYSKLRSETIQAPTLILAPGPTIVIPILYDNQLSARTEGLEAAGSWTPTAKLRIQMSYAWINAHLVLTQSGYGTTADQWSTPTNTGSVRSTWGFARGWSLASSLFLVSRLERPSQTPLPPVNTYVRLDTHVSYRVGERVTVSAGGENLLEGRHPEFDPSDDGYSVRSQVPRSAFVKAVWSF